ncbi:hypothetical protein [Terriglobus aquaticus]|uniref:Glycosyltransferase RgtA/B/C/D-like domain-containing protein n=1 Tax=Terriglobus aquaticus TaxID=940139 RepID=A0ABW9KMB7_9BACT
MRSPGTSPARWSLEPAAHSIWEWLAAAACVLLGVTLILNIHPIGDGMWFWYAVDLRHGVRLYRDLHLALQPLYVLCTAAFQSVFGVSWLASKVFPLVQLLALTFVLVRLGRCLPFAAWQRALLTTIAFLLILQPSTYRFDDYHVTSDVFTLTSLLLLLLLGSRPRTSTTVARFSFFMGVGAGLAAMTRLNDGAALGVGVSLALLLLYPRRAIAALSSVVAGVVVAWGAVLLLARETPADWWQYSIRAASQIKGGTGNILYTPVLLPYHLLLNSLSWKTPVAFAIVAGLFVATREVQRRYRSGVAWLTYAAVWAAVLLALCAPLVYHTQVQTPLELVVRVTVFVGLVAAVGVVVWCVLWLLRGRPALPRPTFALLLLPLWHLLGGALTASNALPDPYLSLSMLVFLLPLLVTVTQAQALVIPVLANLVLVGSIIAAGKLRNPYFWWTYDDGPVYRDRVWYHHPQLGPMYIESQQLALMSELCARVNTGPAPHDLLSMPFPYANYFCGIAPWRGYVQTWYDTSSAATIHTLIGQLQTAPPHWIAYEYDPVAVTGHEITYHQGKPMAHRELKDLVVHKIESGEWTLRQHTCSRMSEWVLIETLRVPDAENGLRSRFDPKGGVCRPDL